MPDANGPSLAGIDGDLLLLQTARLKGRLQDMTAAAFGADLDRLKQLEHSGLLKLGTSGARLTLKGREHLAQLLSLEHQHIDQSALGRLYLEFDVPNTVVKATVSTWQVRPDGTVNDHTDPAYDAAVVARLADSHHQSLPLIANFVDLAPRLAHYPPRLGNALDRARAGEGTFVANPLVDSYHQVWFELHEDLLGLLGRDRVAEEMEGLAE